MNDAARVNRIQRAPHRREKFAAPLALAKFLEERPVQPLERERVRIDPSEPSRDTLDPLQGTVGCAFAGDLQSSEEANETALAREIFHDDHTSRRLREEEIRLAPGAPVEVLQPRTLDGSAPRRVLSARSIIRSRPWIVVRSRSPGPGGPRCYNPAPVRRKMAVDVSTGASVDRATRVCWCGEYDTR